MHIHGGHMNPNASLNGAHGSAATLAARRAEETRKKLFGTASEIDAASSSEGGWMVTAWAGGNSAANQGTSQDSSPNRPDNSYQSKSSADELPRAASAPPTRPVSFWA